MPNLSLQDQTTKFLLYTAPNGEIKVEVLLSDETIWLTQKRMAELFGVGVPAISKHLENIYDSGELQREGTVSILETVRQEGERNVRRKLEYYNLDAVISVGYRVNSAQATQFRIWATQLIKEYIIKGFVMDDERLKNGRYFGKDYFRELLERVRSIRASERRIYQQITDIFAECSIDYDPRSKTTQLFYAHVQDKFHYAITGHTAAEIISLKADAGKPLMGMNTYKNADLNYWSGCAPFGPANGASTSRLPIFLLNAALITTPDRKPPSCSMPTFRTSFITPLLATPPQKSFHSKLMPVSL